METEANKGKKISRITGYVICGITLIIALITFFFLLKLAAVPNRYLVEYSVACLFIIGVFSVVQKWFIPGIIAKILSVVMSVLLICACYYMNYTYNRMQDISGIETQIDSIHVYVMSDNAAQSITDAENYTFGILSTLDRENTDKTIDDINSELSKNIETVEYNSVYDLVEALYGDKVEAIILNAAYISFVEESDEYKTFEEDVRTINLKEIENAVDMDKDINDEYLYNGDDVFTVYISGVDTRSAANVNSNSDVNILLTVNMNTRQILMISTPRDYYVPLSISNGVKDKLTHAGGYGIDVSVDTLEMLYGVNIDDYVRINFTGFQKIIDVLGGVNVYSEYDFKAEHYSYHKGYNELNGGEALEFARTRYAFIDGDRQRGKNQMAVIKAVINEMATSDALFNYTDILDAISDSMITSMSYNEISELVKFQLNDMRGWDVVTYSVNGFDSSNTTYSGGSQMLYVMIPDESTVEQAKQYLEDIYDNKEVSIMNGETNE